MVTQNQLRAQIDNLADLVEKVENQRDNIGYLEEIKQTEGLTPLKAQLELADQQIELNISAIARRTDKLTDEDKERFVKLIPGRLHAKFGGSSHEPDRGTDSPSTD